MANQNPSGPNQPLNQHPLPNVEIYTVAKDAALFSGLVIASGDTLIVSPPVEGGRRQVLGSCIRAGVTGSGTASADVQIIYKNKNSDESRLDALTLVADDIETPSGGIYLLPEDEGLFLRVTIDPPGETVFVYTTWNDVRNVERYDTPLSLAFQNVNPQSPLGNTAFSPLIGVEIEDDGIWIFNFDTVDHAAEIQLTDGTTFFPFPPTGTIVAGASVRMPIQPCLVLPPGFYIRARLLEPVASVAPVFSLPLALINQGPARQEQGGAY